jgi:O-6-methylguanine DNA methyltransferase
VFFRPLSPASPPNRTTNSMSSTSSTISMGLRPSQIFWDSRPRIEQVGLFPVGKSYLLLAESEFGLCGLFLGDCPARLLQHFDERFRMSLSISFSRLLPRSAKAFSSASWRPDQWLWTADPSAATPGISKLSAPDLLEEIHRAMEAMLVSDSAVDLSWSGPLQLSGTPFQQRVWQELTRIPWGHTISYGELARRLNCPSAVRAVAAACGANPVAVIVPCHRVIAKTGRLTGYRWGLELKQLLLQREQTFLPFCPAHSQTDPPIG